jgi:hypothetical protein
MHSSLSHSFVFVLSLFNTSSALSVIICLHIVQFPLYNLLALSVVCNHVLILFANASAASGHHSFATSSLFLVIFHLLYFAFILLHTFRYYREVI